MAQTKEYTVFSFDELSDTAKDRARNWFRECRFEDGPDTFEHVIEDAARMAGILGIDVNNRPVKLMNGSIRYDPAIYWSLCYSQSDGAWLDRASYSYAKGASKAIRDEAPQDTTLHALANRLATLQRRHFYTLSAQWHDSDRGRSEISVDCDKGGSLLDDSEKELRDILREFQSWVYDQLRKEDEYQNADEQIDENIRANEYTFAETGERED